jgi:hypothetical protein
MMNNSKKLLVLLFLGFIFFAPGIAAYIFYNHTQWLGTATTNHGELINPPPVMSFLSQDKWKLILWSPNECSEQCKIDMDKLARIRLALGRRLYEVDGILMQANQTAALPDGFEQQLKDEAITSLKLTPEQTELLKPWATEAKIFIVNPQNYLILAYTSSVEPKNIYQDLKHLLHMKE